MAIRPYEKRGAILCPVKHKEHHRCSMRLKRDDYSKAWEYFVTLRAYGRECLFGEIENGIMRLNEYGDVVTSEWMRSAEVRLEIECCELVVMPNHFHGIVRMTNHVDAATVGAYGNTPYAAHPETRAYCHTPLQIICRIWER